MRDFLSVLENGMDSTLTSPSCAWLQNAGPNTGQVQGELRHLNPDSKEPFRTSRN